MIHTATGYWIREAGEPELLAALDGEGQFDVLIVGGGFTGMWTAWHLTRTEPDLKIGLLEAERIGFGPSGRNGGFIGSMWESFRVLLLRYGVTGALELARASEESVGQIGNFLAERGVDAWFRRDGIMKVSTAPAWDGAWRETLDALTAAGANDRAEELGPEEVAAICDSPAFRGGIFYPEAATVQPARLCFALRDALIESGVALFENSPVTAIDDGPAGVVARSPAGRVTADRLVLANGSALAGRRSPLRNAVTVASSHMLITEPVPDLLEEAGWTGGQGITDCRSLVTYFRTTPDRRIALGWGGGRIAAGSRRGGTAEIDPGVIRQVTRILHRYFPGTETRQVEYAWGGPVDASASHLPHVIRMPSGRVFAAFGYTGSGVGPSQLVGRSLASLTLGREDRYTGLPFVGTPDDLTPIPPEPFRWLGGAAIRTAIARVEDRKADGLRPGLVSRAIAGIPALIGFHIGR